MKQKATNMEQEATREEIDLANLVILAIDTVINDLKITAKMLSRKAAKGDKKYAKTMTVYENGISMIKKQRVFITQHGDIKAIAAYARGNPEIISKMLAMANKQREYGG
jgi:ribosomal protein S1